MAASTPAQHRRLWFGALTSPIAWSTHFLASYSVLEVACNLPRALGPSAVPTIVLALTAVAVGATLVAGWMAYQQWRRLAKLEQAKPRSAGEQRAAARRRTAGSGGSKAALDSENERFMAAGGMLLGGLFAFLTIMTALPALVLAPCR